MGELILGRGKVLGFTYKNHRGETAERSARFEYVYWGKTEWHPETQWLMHAFDFDKEAMRDFAMKDMSAVVSL